MLDQLIFMIMIKPVAFIVEVFLGTPFIFYEGIGYVNESLKINIGKECSGINFFIIVFFMLIFSFGFKIKDKKRKILLISIFLFYSYILTIIVNGSRIIGSIFIMNLNLFSNVKQKILIHQSIGVVFYFTYLVLSYFLFHQIKNKYNINIFKRGE